MFLHVAIDCSDGDVHLTVDKVPMVYWNNTWSPICGHYFWDNDNGANLFCKKLGYINGTVYPGKAVSPLSRQGYSQDALRIGKCDARNSVLTRCSGGCNDMKIGGRCYENEDASCSKGEKVKITINCFGGSEVSKKASCTGESTSFY